MKEKYWDPINKSAALVTLFTGIPAFLTFIGLPYLAAIILGILSIASLSFVLIRGRKLEARANRLAALNKVDERLISSFNGIIAAGNIDKTPTNTFKSLLTEALDNIREYIESDTGCKAIVSLRELKKNFDVVETFASSNRDSKPINFNLKEDSRFQSVFSNNPSGIFYTDEKAKSLDFNLPQFTVAYQTAAIFPIMTKTKDYWDNECFQYLGFLVVDIEKNKVISNDTKLILFKYSQIFFMLLFNLNTSLSKIAQQG